MSEIITIAQLVRYRKTLSERKFARRSFRLNHSCEYRKVYTNKWVPCIVIGVKGNMYTITTKNIDGSFQIPSSFITL